jgi:hypothetical protein
LRTLSIAPARLLAGECARAPISPTDSIPKHARVDARRGKAGVRHESVNEKKLPPTP